MSQLDLAGEAEISQRHLSFVESGRAAPSRDMVIQLSERLEIPLRQRNRLLLAAGFAPGYGESRLDDASFAPAMDAVRMVLKGHEPNPAAAVDRHWNLVAANRAIGAAAGRRRRRNRCSSRRSMCCGSACIPAASRRASSISRSGGPICWNGCGARTRRSRDPALEELERELRSYPGGVDADPSDPQ